MAGRQQQAAFGFVAGGGHHQIGNAAQKAQIISTGVGGAVGTDNTGAVDGKQHRQVLQSHIVNQLVVGALQKGRINRHHRLGAFAGQTGGKGNCVLLGNAHIEIALRKGLLKRHQAAAFAHGGGNRHQFGIGPGLIYQPLAEHLGVGGLGGCGGFGRALARVELAHGMKAHGIVFGQLVALPFFGDDVQQLRPFAAPHVLQHFGELEHIVAVYRAAVAKAEIIKQRQRRLCAVVDHVFDFVFHPLRHV